MPFNKPEFRLFDFQVLNIKYDDAGDEEEKYKDNKRFLIKMYGMNEKGKTCCIFVKNFEPFFYILVPDKWEKPNVRGFKFWLKEKMGQMYEDSVTFCKLRKGKKLYGFNNFKENNFLQIGFKNHTAFNKAKKLWFEDNKNFKKRKLKKKGLEYEDSFLKLYESNLPPLLRYFHIQDISPSGWITFKNSVRKIKKTNKKTYCNYEYETDYKNIVPLLEKETGTPMTVMSWDIEASSSHGDFPVAKKSYRKMIGEIIQYWTRNKKEISKKSIEEKNKLFVKLSLAAFEYGKVNGISRVYLQSKSKPSLEQIKSKLNKILGYKLGKLLERRDPDEDNYFEKMKWDAMDDEEKVAYKDWDMYIPWEFKKNTLVNCLTAKYDAGKKLDILDKAIGYDRNKKIPGFLPKLEGDKCTFIGSTFLRLGEKEPYYNNMIVLNRCDDTPEVPNSEIVSRGQERNVLLEWAKLIKTEDPDIIIGYNTFGFDWHFLLDRADELNCKDEFLKLMNRNKNEKSEIINSTTKVASGTYELVYVKIPGRIQIDLYNYFRKAENLPSYKLDYVASHFIGDIVKDYDVIENKTKIKSKNLMGLKNGHFIVFEILGHSSDKYKEGKKFKISNLQNDSFEVDYKIDIDKKHKFRWCLAKDDVTPQDIFRLTNEGASSRAIVAKYCFQDCNLVHNLMIKNDIYTAMVEQAKICSVPIEFIAMRGQGIKLLSFIAKECRKIKTFMPMLQKSESNDGFEGAIVLEPKTGLYRKNPVAVNDYSSLYPSCMISENISQDTKVWTKEYDLAGNEIKIWGERDKDGNFIYDNLADYKYVDIQYDTYKYVRKTPASAAQKIKCGRKICRFVQFHGEDKGIMPTVLRELLASRKATRKLIKFKTVTLKNGESYSGLLNKGEDEYTIIPEKGDKISVNKEDVEKIEDTYNDFMKNVFDKRQLSKKVVANSLYGQTGAKTSAFYDKDIAASTTATGRKLLLYAKRIVEECYKDRIVETKNYGKVKSKSVISRSEYIYGDSVTKDTPLLLKNKNTGNIEFKQINNLNNVWKEYDGFKAGESNRREKQQANVSNYQIYTSKGWSDIKRVIRHKTIKQMYRVNTHTGVVDVTEDHSLLDEQGKILKPTEIKIGQTLLHNYPTFEKTDMKLEDILTYIKNIEEKSISEKKAFIYGFFYGDGSCGYYNCPSGKKYSWALNQKNIETCKILQSLCEEIFGDKFKINNTIKSSGVYKIVPNCGNIKKYVDLFREKCYNKDKLKIIPTDYLNGNKELKIAYFAGYYLADGSKCKNEKGKSIRLDNKGKIGSAMLYYLCKSLGFNVSLNTRSDKLSIIRLTCTTNKQRKNPKIIKKIDKLGLSNDFVYDIETETGNFNTGFELIVKNTDSVFFTFNLEELDGTKIEGKKALEITIELAIQAGELATMYLKKPHDLEYEKTFMPFLLLSKKRYVGMLYETNPNKCKMKSMGIVLKRRDNAACVKDCYGRVVDLLMKGESADIAANFVKSYIKDMVNEKIGLDKLIITKSLNGFYKNPDSIAHKVLADRIAKRDPGNKPSVGSRVPFIYIQTKKEVKLQGDRVESPNYIIENKLKPDYSFYITNQIMKPVTQIFSLLLEQMSDFKGTIKLNYKREYNKIQNKYSEDDKKLKEKITKLRDGIVKKLIFENSLRVSDNSKKGLRTINSFFKVKK